MSKSIESLLSEDREFKPIKEFSNKARISSMAQYKRLHIHLVFDGFLTPPRKTYFQLTPYILFFSGNMKIQISSSSYAILIILVFLPQNQVFPDGE